MAYSILVEDLNPVGIPSRDISQSNIRLYPNPAETGHILDISATTEEWVSVVRYNTQGQFLGEVYEGKLHTGNNPINLNISDLSQGLYFYRIQTDKGSNYQKFIKK